MKANMQILVVGAGPVGATVGGWLAPKWKNLTFFDKPEVAKTLSSKGITLYEQHKKDKATTVPVKAVSDLKKAPKPDIVLIAVKTYSLDAVCSLLKKNFGSDLVAVGLQNGVDNQQYLPNYFPRSLYCVVCYNAWSDEPGVIGFQKRGPLVLGTPDNSNRVESKSVAAILNLGVETVVTDHFQDAAYSKMIINLTNSLTTLIGHGFQPVSDDKLFQKVLTNLTKEGVEIVKAAGYEECSLGGMPGWFTIQAAATLPQIITKPIFDQNVKKMVVSSMAQDVIQNKSGNSELETINGHLLEMARQNGVKTPYNTTVYELCQKAFTQENFKPMDIKEVWAEVKKRL